MRGFSLVIALVAGATTAHGQATIYGLDVRNNFFITSDTTDFVGNFTQVNVNADPVFALDFDADATTLWGVKNDTLEYGTFDLSTGAFNALGTVSGPTAGATGLTAAADGLTWYLSEYDGVLARSFLYVGDVTTGSFTQVGFMGGGIFIDISIDSLGNLYGHSISDDSLYRVDTATGFATLIGPTGQAANFAQGMDFDWSDNTLYATIYTGSGTGVFATLDLATGAAIVLQDTTPLDTELEIAIEVAAGIVGTPFCFGDGSGSACPCGNSGNAGEGCANSSGSGGLLEGLGGTSVAADDLVFAATQLLPGQPALLFVGNNAINGGLGIPFGDGLRCAGGTVIRLGVMSPNASGEAAWGPGLGAVGGWSNGDTRRFQGWYRDPTSSPCGFGFNLTNGFEVTFTP